MGQMLRVTDAKCLSGEALQVPLEANLLPCLCPAFFSYIYIFCLCKWALKCPEFGGPIVIMQWKRH